MRLKIALFSLFVICASDNESVEKTEKIEKLSKFRDDINQISVDFENFVYDIVTEVLVDTDVLNNGRTEGKTIIDAIKLSTKNTIGKKILDNQMKNFFQKHTPNHFLQKRGDITGTTTLPTNVLDNYVKQASNVLSKSRYRRSSSDDKIANIIDTQNSNINKNTDNCSPKTEKEQFLERQHIEDLKEEVKKLHDLVILLKDQQKIITLLDQDKTHFEEDLPQGFHPKDLIKVLEDLNNHDTTDDNNGKFPQFINTYAKSNSASDNTEVIKPTHQELDKIKYDLRQTIAVLNKTREMLIEGRNQELLLETELKRQKMELNILKMMVEKLYHNSSNFERSVLQTPHNTSIANEVLGAPIYLPKELGVLRNRNISRESMGTFQRRREKKPIARTSDLENLLNELDKPKTDITSEMMKLQREINKKNQEDIIKKLLQKVLEQKESKSLDTQTDNSELIKKLHTALKVLNKPESKSDDDAIQSELKKLENAINSLKPKEFDNDLTESGQSDDLEKLRELLNDLSKQGSSNIQGGTGSNKGLSPQQLIQLRKRLEQISSGGMGGSPMFSNLNSNFALGPQSIDTRRGPPPYPEFSENYGNFASPYTPYPNGPYQPGVFNNFHGLQPNGYNFPPTHMSPNTYQTDNYNPFPAINSYQSHFGTNTESKDYRPKPSGGYPFSNDYGKSFSTNPSSYDFSKQYGANSINPVANDYNKPYGGTPNPNLYSKTFGDPQKPLPYAQSIPNPPNYTPDDASSQFFPGPQPNPYETSGSNSIYTPENINGGNPSQSGAYLPKNTYGVDYKTKNIEDLKTQVNSLQGVINSLSYSGYAKKPEDQSTIANLEQQMNELKGVINSLNQETPQSPSSYDQIPPNYDQNSPPIAPQYSSRRRRSIDDNNEDALLYDQLTSKLKEYLFQNEKLEDRNTFQDAQNRISNIKSQLENHFDSSHERYVEQPGSYNSYQPPYYESYYKNTPKAKSFDLITPKKQDLFNSIVIKLFDKVLGVIPSILQRIFGYGIYELTNFNDQYDYNNGYHAGYSNQSDLKNLFKSLGIFGYVPLILLKIIDGFASFIYILKKNKFFKNFLLPALILLIIAGAVIFLIWWLQPGDEYKYYPQIDYKQQDYNANNYNPSTYNNYDKSKYDHTYKSYQKPKNGYNTFDNNLYHPPEYSRSYFDTPRDIKT